jgi:hypothetical protein
MPNPKIQRFALPRISCLTGILAVCVLFSSCGSSNTSIEQAKQSVVQFHSQLDTEQYSVIYAASDEKFRQATSQTDLATLLEAVHRKLGAVEQSNLRNTGVAWFAGQGATVTLIYDTRFAEGTGSEKFVWHVKDNVPALYSYNIMSNELITK